MTSNPSIASLSLVSLVLAVSCSLTSSFAFTPSYNSGTARVQHRTAGAARRHTGAPAAGVPTTMVAAEPVAGLMKTVTVELEDRSYPIYIGEGILDR